MAGKLIVVKFAQMYCPEAHKLLANHSLAPQLLYHKEIEGAGIHFVVMEWLDANFTTKLIGKDEDSKQFVRSLHEVVCALHGEGFVFGDLHLPNILIMKGGLKLVDFDWCGKEGEAQYPANLFDMIGWPEGIRGEGKITQDHDKAWFKQLTSKDL